MGSPEAISGGLPFTEQKRRTAISERSKLVGGSSCQEKEWLPGGGTYVVRSCNRNTVLKGMPAHVQDLLVEVDLVGIGLLLHPTAGTGGAARSRASLLSIALVHGRWYANLLRLEGRLVRLQHNLRLLLLVCRVDHEVIVITAGHDVLGITGEHHLELVENAVVLIRIAQAGPQMLVDRNRLDWLAFHVDIPNLHSQVIPGNDVAAVV
jgi:hypothetical protein